MRCIVSVVAFILMVFLARSTRAQSIDDTTRWYLGPIGEVTFVAYHSDVFPALAGEPDRFLVQNGSGTDAALGVRCEYALTASHHSFLLLELQRDSRSGTFTSINAGADTGCDLSATISDVTVNVGYKYNLIDGSRPIGPGIGLSASIGVVPRRYFTRKVWYRKENMVVISMSDIPAAAELEFSLRPEITYDIPIGSRFAAAIHAGYNYTPTPVIQASLPQPLWPTGARWTTDASFVGASLEYAIN